jgi:hypothetical protein
MSRRYQPTDTPRELIEFYDGAPDQALIPTGNAKDRRANAKDRRVKQVPTIGLLRRIGEMDRRAHSTQPEPTSPADTTELLSKYRAALIHAYELGKEVKIVYGIVPPKVLHRVGNEFITLSLGVN